MKSIAFLTLAVVLSQCAVAHGAQEGFAAPEPTPQHELLKKDVGNWTGEMKMFAGGTDAPQVTIPIKETNKLMAGGLWVISDFDATVFVGHGQFGYDTNKKKYVGTWVDNMTASVMSMEGDFDKKTGELTMYSQVIDPATGQKQDTKSVSKYTDADSRTFTMFTKAGDDWVKTFVIEYKREK